jgi:hypothetical protein
MYCSLIRIHHQNEQTKKRDLKNIQDIMVFLGTLNENGNFTYSQAEEKCVLCSPISSLGCASARTSDERDALFDLRTQITIIFIVLIQVSFKEFTVFYIVKYLTKKLKKRDSNVCFVFMASQETVQYCAVAICTIVQRNRLASHPS